MVARTIPVDPFDLVIFGATGDLARRKILPSLYRRRQAGQMPEGARVIGAELAKDIADAYLSAAFDPQGKSAGNVKAIDEVDIKYTKA